MHNMKYHTALKKEGYEPDEKSSAYFYEKDGNVALVHNITETLPKHFDRADVLYAEVPWRYGYNEFMKRAHVVDINYQDFLSGLNRIIKENNKPIIILGGKELGKYIPKPQQVFNTRLIIGSYAVAYVYNYSMKPFEISAQIIDFLATRFNCLGNFCCGYGYTGNIFFRSGKKFVMSDVNSGCIGHIKSNYENL